MDRVVFRTVFGGSIIHAPANPSDQPAGPPPPAESLPVAYEFTSIAGAPLIRPVAVAPSPTPALQAATVGHSPRSEEMECCPCRTVRRDCTLLSQFSHVSLCFNCCHRLGSWSGSPNSV